MKTVRDYRKKGVVFVDGDVITSSDDPERGLDWDRCNRDITCSDGVVESFAWRNITGAVPQHGLDGNMLVEIAFYNNHRDNGVKQMPVGDIQWGLPTVNKAWRPIASAQQPLVHVGAELVFDTTDVVIVAETTVDICIHIVSDDSLLAVPVTQSHRFSPRKPPEQVELEADLITFLKGIDEGVLITGAKDVEFLATEFIKAGYRKG